MTKFISLKETANLIRETLKVEFPDIKFSVRSKSFSNGSSVDVTWTDGPTWQTVNDAISFYKGAEFDGMIDLSTDVYHTNEGGERIHYGAKFVSAHRHFSAEFLQHMATYAEATYGFTEAPEFKVIQPTEHCHAYVEGNNKARFGNDWAINFLTQLCAKTDAANMPTIPQPEIMTEAQVKPVKLTPAASPETAVINRLQSVDILNITPLEALNILAELKKLAIKE